MLILPAGVFLWFDEFYSDVSSQRKLRMVNIAVASAQDEPITDKDADALLVVEENKQIPDPLWQFIKAKFLQGDERAAAFAGFEKHLAESVSSLALSAEEANTNSDDPKVAPAESKPGSEGNAMPENDFNSSAKRGLTRAQILAHPAGYQETQQITQGIRPL